MRLFTVVSTAAGLVLWAGGLAGQTRAPVGVQIGYSRADLGGSAGERLASRQGALAGVYLTGRLGSFVAIQPELLFALKGGRTLAPLAGGDTTLLDVELAYLELPIVTKVSLVPRRRLQPVIFGGIAPAIRIGCDRETVTETGTSRTACEDLEGLTFERMDIGAVLGTGLHLEWPETSLGLEVRYTTGLRSVFGAGVEARNRQLGILVTLNF